MRKVYKFNMDFLFLSIGALLIFLITSLPIFLFCPWFQINFNTNVVIFIFLWLILHELLHGIGFRLFSGVKHKNIKYGIALEKGIFYCMCQQKIGKSNILASLILPFIAIGVITFFIGIILEDDILTILSLINIAGSAGDIAMFISILMMPKSIEYIDYDDSSSFYLISDTDLSKSKLIGLKHDKSSIWNDDYSIPIRNKISISKYSWVILSIFVVIAIVDYIL